MSQDARAQRVLLELNLISEKSAARHGDLVRGGMRDNAPRGPKLSEADELLRAYEKARTDGERELIIEAAEQAIREAKYSRRGLVKGTVEWRVAIALDPRPVDVVAWIYGCSRQHVYKMRTLGQ